MAKKTKKPAQLDLFGDPIEEKRHGSEIVLDDFKSHAIRRIMIKGVPWWVAVDLCRILEIGNASLAVNGRERKRDDGTTYWSDGLDDDERGVASVNTPSGTQEMLIVNESGLYNLIFSSRKPEAKEFRRWVTHEVLPSIRKTGAYTQKNSRSARLSRRMKTDDHGLIMHRVDQVAKNKEINASLASQGACPRDFQAIHNACWRGQMGAEAKQLRAQLGLKGYETPLDHLGSLPLAQNHHAKALAQVRIEQEGATSIEEKCAIMEETAHYVTASDFGKLREYRYGVVECPRRGKVLDMVRGAIEVG